MAHILTGQASSEAKDLSVQDCLKVLCTESPLLKEACHNLGIQATCWLLPSLAKLNDTAVLALTTDQQHDNVRLVCAVSALLLNMLHLKRDVEHCLNIAIKSEEPALKTLCEALEGLKSTNNNSLLALKACVDCLRIAEAAITQGCSHELVGKTQAESAAVAATRDDAGDDGNSSNSMPSLKTVCSLSDFHSSEWKAYSDHEKLQSSDAELE
ncbi:hypothetical protein NM688_g5200 [Phlebia brevispora]|uniref:Uncharacterized protein n=1 Tax=Phlebia brevispora TaxID=194682 RepID=A0ACC1SZ92_9APHY|nr:hypothetical protein NM688_g5200 [Phlebia brevispora]